MQPDSASERLKLTELYKRPEVNQLTGFVGFASKLASADIATAYSELLDSAPRRHARGKRYFVGHTGVPSTGASTNRREEHLALALWGRARDRGPLFLPTGQALELLDYQFPLKAALADKGIGKVDLFGVIDGSSSCVIELKIHPAGAGKADTPLRAWLEALAYCAVVEANIPDISGEARELFGLRLDRAQPDLVVMATLEYWHAYARHPRAGDWWPALRRLAGELDLQLGIRSHFVALEGCDFRLGVDGQRPLLAGDCGLLEVSLLFDD